MSELLTQTKPEFKRSLLDGLDYYKLTMGQIAFEKFRNEEVTFTMKNRADEFPLSEYVDIPTLKDRFNEIIANGFSDEDIAYLASIEAQDGTARFSEEYLDFLANLELVDVDIELDEATNDLSISAKGPWANVSLWETVVMSEVNEQYYRNLLKEKGLTEEEVWAEGDRRLDEKIAILKERPDIKFADFGTRRRFSAEFHDHVIGRLVNELSENFIGTSNPWFAHQYNLAPIGTYAHEMPMVYAALHDHDDNNPLDGHGTMMVEWFGRYDKDLSIALTDTFTSDFFFDDFTDEQARDWRGLRHDSGDPIEFGEKAIKFYEARGIDPLEKTIVFSDGLDLDTIIMLADHFAGKVNILFGWGTTLMNDLGLRANNFVMKATNVNGIDTVKLSDNEGKHTGPTEQVDRYAAYVEARTMVDEVFETQGLVTA